LKELKAGGVKCKTKKNMSFTTFKSTAAADTLSALAAPAVSPTTSSTKRVHNLVCHLEQPLEFLLELKMILRVVTSEMKYGIGWNKKGDCVILSDPIKFQKLLHQGEVESNSTMQQLKAFDKTMVRLRFRAMSYSRRSTLPTEFLPRMYRHDLFRSNSTTQELKWIVGQVVATLGKRHASLATAKSNPVCFSLPVFPVSNGGLEESRKETASLVTPEKGGAHVGTTDEHCSPINAAVFVDSIFNDAISLEEICQNAAQKAVAARADTYNATIESLNSINEKKFTTYDNVSDMSKTGVFVVATDATESSKHDDNDSLLSLSPCSMLFDWVPTDLSMPKSNEDATLTTGSQADTPETPKDATNSPKLTDDNDYKIGSLDQEIDSVVVRLSRPKLSSYNDIFPTNGAASESEKNSSNSIHSDVSAKPPIPNNHKTTDCVLEDSAKLADPPVTSMETGGESKTQDGNKVTDDEEECFVNNVADDLDRIVKEWKENNPKAFAKEWNGWGTGEISFTHRRPRLWHPRGSKGGIRSVDNKRMVLVLMSGRGSASSTEEMRMKKYTPQLRRETARCLVLEKLLTAQVHALDKRVIADEFVSPLFFHQGDLNDLRRMSSSTLLKEKQFDEIVMDYAWWENAYVQDRITESFFTESLPKLMRSCKPTGSIFLPCTPYLFAQTVLAVSKRNDDEDDELEDRDVEKHTEWQQKSDVKISLLSQEDAADRIAFWNATEVIKNNKYLMSKDPVGLTERIGMGEGREAQKKLRQVCAFLSNASVNIVLEQYKKLKVNKPLFIQICKAKEMTHKQKRKKTGALMTSSKTLGDESFISGVVKKRSALWHDTKVSKRNKSEKKDFVGERVYIRLNTLDGDDQYFYGTVQGKRTVLGRDVYDVVFDQDNSSFSYLPKNVEEGMDMYHKQRRGANANSRIIDVEYV
jgi:hypothetical protein